MERENGIGDKPNVPHLHVHFSSYFLKIIYDHFPYWANEIFSGYIIKPQSEEVFLIECGHGKQCVHIAKILVKIEYGKQCVQIAKILVKIEYIQNVHYGVISTD